MSRAADTGDVLLTIAEVLAGDPRSEHAGRYAWTEGDPAGERRGAVRPPGHGMDSRKLRRAFDGVPDDTPVRVVPADEPGSDFAGDEQVVISAGPWTAEGVPPSEMVPADHFEISCEFPSGQYYRRRR